MVAVIGALPVFVAVKEGTFPVPLAANPIAVLLFVQVNVTPVVGLLKEDWGTLAPLHTEKLEGTTTVAVGFTVIV